MDAPGIPPKAFLFRTPDAWSKWKKRFDRYRMASGLEEKSKPVQVSTLVYSMGGDAEDILASFDMTEEDSQKYEEVSARFDAHFIKRRNPIFERARFNQRRQTPGESVDQFATALHTLAEHCDFKTLKDEMIRDRLVVGLLYADLSERLQLEHNLTLKTAVMKARQSEAVKEQQATVCSEATGARRNEAWAAEDTVANECSAADSVQGLAQRQH